MANEKNINSRVQHKHDTEANWNKATNFIPKAGEIIIYDADLTYNYPRIKIGDGNTLLSTLSFIDKQKQDKITGTAGQFVIIGDDGNVTTKTVPYAEEASF